MSELGYKKGKGKLNRLIVHNPYTGGVVIIYPPPPKPKKMIKKNFINSPPQNFHQPKIH